MNPISALRVAAGVARAATRWERPDRLPGNLIVAGLIGPTVAGAVAGATVRDPDRIAVDDRDTQLTYGELWRSSQAFASRLRAAGVTDRSVVGLLAANSAEFVIGLVAVSIVGADTVYLNTGFAAPQLADVCEREGVTDIVCDHRHSGIVESIGRIGWVPESTASSARPGGSVIGWSPILGSSSATPSRRTARQVILTSGTTGRPKGANRSRMNASGLGIFAVVPIRSGDRVVIACPLFHAWGLSNLMIALTLGSTIRLPPDSSPASVYAQLGSLPGDDVPADGLVVVPAVLQRLVGPDAGATNHGALRYVVSSGARLPPPVVEASLRLFGPTLYNFYGSTEVSLATIATPSDLAADPSTAGRPVPGTSVEILDDDGERVPSGEVGRVFVDAANAFDGYTGGGDKPRRGRLVDTGDLGHIDDGLLYIDGRSDDMIVSGGENVFPGEVEDLIVGLDGVIEAAVIGVDDAEFGQRLVAAVVAEEHVSGVDVQTAVRSSLARFKVPRDVYFFDELPRTESGKVRRAELTALLMSRVSEGAAR